MKPKRHPNCTQVANDCMLLFLARHMKIIAADRHDISPAIAPMVDALEKIIVNDIPVDVLMRIKRTNYMKRMEIEFADHGLTPYTCFQHLTEQTERYEIKF